MEAPAPSGERGALGRLSGEEAVLERRIADARHEAAAAVECARREAGAIVAEMRREAEREAAGIRAAAEEALDRARDLEHASLDAAVADLEERAVANRARALARALALARGEEAP